METTEEINTGYALSRQWFNWCFEHTSIVNPNHTAMYFFIIEHWNRMGWKKEFGFPMQMCMDAIGIKNYRTYSKTFEDLVSWGFLKVMQRSKNQYSANVIALVKNTKPNTNALSKATQKHSQKQVYGIVGIDKPNNLITLEPNNNITPHDVFIKTLNAITGKSFKGNKKTIASLDARINEGYSMEDIEQAIKNCFADSFHQQNRHFLTPEFILRADKLEKYKNAGKIITMQKQFSNQVSAL